MQFTLRLSTPAQTDLGLAWQFYYRGYPCRLVASETRLRLWMDDKEIEPSRVLRQDELEDWLFMCHPHCLEHGVLARRKAALGFLVLISEVILRRYADVLEGTAPPGYGNQ